MVKLWFNGEIHQQQWWCMGGLIIKNVLNKDQPTNYWDIMESPIDTCWWCSKSKKKVTFTSPWILIHDHKQIWSNIYFLENDLIVLYIFAYLVIAASQASRSLCWICVSKLHPWEIWPPHGKDMLTKSIMKDL